MIIALIIYTMTMKKLRQIAMLKLIGAPDRTMVAKSVQQALALGLTGFMFGTLLIANIKGFFSEPDKVLALGGVVSFAFWRAVLASERRSRRTSNRAGGAEHGLGRAPGTTRQSTQHLHPLNTHRRAAPGFY